MGAVKWNVEAWGHVLVIRWALWAPGAIFWVLI